MRAMGYNELKTCWATFFFFPEEEVAQSGSVCVKGITVCLC